MSDEITAGPAWAAPELGLVLPATVAGELVLQAGAVPVIPRLRADVFAAVARLIASGKQVQARPAVFEARPALVVSGKQVQARSVTFSAVADFVASSLIGAPVFAGEARLVVAGVEQQRRLVELAGAASLSFSGREVQSRAVTFSASAELLAAALETQQRAVVFGAVADLDAAALETQSRGVTFAAVAENTSVAVLFAPSGMTKNGTQPFTTSWAQLNGWTANTGTYPGSTVVNNALQVQGSKPDATIAVSLPYSSTFSNNRRARIKVNGTVVATSAGFTANSGTITVTATGVAVADGDDITIEVIMETYASGSISSGGTVTVT